MTKMSRRIAAIVIVLVLLLAMVACRTESTCDDCQKTFSGTGYCNGFQIIP